LSPFDAQLEKRAEVISQGLSDAFKMIGGRPDGRTFRGIRPAISTQLWIVTGTGLRWCGKITSGPDLGASPGCWVYTEFLCVSHPSEGSCSTTTTHSKIIP